MRERPTLESQPRTSVPTAPQADKENVTWTTGIVRIAGATDVGAVRRINQDAFAHFHLAERGETLLVVADGLGGHQGGEVASAMAVEALGKLIDEGDDEPSVRLTRAIASANETILTAARKDRALDGMGTTVVCLLLAENGRSFVAHVGDSRLYRLRGGALDPITEDHSLVVTLVREGILSAEDAREDPRRNQILRALGVREDIEIEVAPLNVMPGDRYLLCSDGLHGLIEDTEIQRLAIERVDPESVVASLIDAANAAGGNDNITCLVAVLPPPSFTQTLRIGVTRIVQATRSLLVKARPS
jgi:serine/threonine protein phosphatase PrpC